MSHLRKANASDLPWQVHHWFPSIYAWVVVYFPRVQRLVLIWWEKWLRTSWMKRGAGTAGSKVELLETGDPGGAETSSFEQKIYNMCFKVLSHRCTFSFTKKTWMNHTLSTLSVTHYSFHELQLTSCFWHTNDNDFHQASLWAATTYGWDGIATFGASEERSERRGGAWDGAFGCCCDCCDVFFGKGRTIRLAWLFGTSEISRVETESTISCKRKASSAHWYRGSLSRKDH